MCTQCDDDVAQVGAYLDGLIQAHVEVNDEHYQQDSSAQHCVRLACLLRDDYLRDQGIAPLQRLCLALAIAVHRLGVLQQINGGVL